MHASSVKYLSCLDDGQIMKKACARDACIIPGFRIFA